MIMTREKKVVEKKDLLSADIYEKNRKQIRKELVEFKKNRKVALGPYATFYFENFDTMLGQIQEMLYIEKGGDQQLKDELEAYNPLNTSLSYIIESMPSNGLLVESSLGTYQYSPFENYNGDDSFQFSVYNEEFYSNIAVISITINPSYQENLVRPIIL